MIEDLPEETQDLLRSDLNQPKPNLGPRLSDALTSALRDQGFVIDQDASGIRLGGDLSRRGGASGSLSALDLIRMASDMDGGLPSPDELIRCPKCEALIPPNETRCSWCGTPLEDQPPSTEEA
jgi:hypothetical protein